MKQVSVPLSDILDAHMRARIDSGDFRDEGDYLQALVARDRDRTDALAAAIDDGIASGVSERSVMGIFEDAKRRRLEPRPQ